MITKIESPITTTNPYRPEEELGGRCEGKNKPEPNTPGARLAGLMGGCLDDQWDKGRILREAGAVKKNREGRSTSTAQYQY